MPTSGGLRLIRIIMHHCFEHLSCFLFVVCIILLLSFYYCIPMYHYYVIEFFVTIIMLLCTINYYVNRYVSLNFWGLLVYYYCICCYVVIIAVSYTHLDVYKRQNIL